MMCAAKPEGDSLVVRFKRFVERRLGIVLIIAAVIGGIATFAGNVEKLIDSLRKIFKPGSTRTESTAVSGTPSVASDNALRLGGGNFAGVEWRFLQGRGIVQIREEKITLATHRAEALAWIDTPPRHDFRFSCAMELVSGDTSLGFGPVFWLRDERNFFHFAVRTAGQYRLVRYHDGQAEELIPWTPSPKVRGVNTIQTLQVVAKNNLVELFIDDSLVQSYQLPVEQSEVGRAGVFAVDGGLTVDITRVQRE
jgi:hypothetical protein